MNTILKLVAFVLAGSVGFVAGQLVPVSDLRNWLAMLPVAAAATSVAAPPTPIADVPIAELVTRCDRAVRDLRWRAFLVDQEREHLATERRLVERARDPTWGTQVQRIKAADAVFGDQRAALQREIDDLLGLADRLSELQREAPAAAPEPDWVHEARVRLKLASLDEGR